jgi:hypothetical protein
MALATKLNATNATNALNNRSKCVIFKAKKIGKKIKRFFIY